MAGAPAIANTRIYRNHHLDSTRWQHLRPHEGDIIVSTPYKTGTTWTQRILAALIHGPEVPLTRELTPWIDARFWGPIEPITAAIDEQTHRRFIKSHLAVDGLPWRDDASYVIIGRDPRDIFMSLLNHYAAYTDVALALLNDEANPGEPIPTFDGDVATFWRRWISESWFEWERDGWPFWSAFHHLETWWSVRDRPNVLLLHYGDMKADPHQEISRLAQFLAIDLSPAALDAVVEVSSFDRMRSDLIAKEAASGGPDGSIFEGGMATFMHKGTNGRWREVLTEDDLELYEERASQLEPAFRSWLEAGTGG